MTNFRPDKMRSNWQNLNGQDATYSSYRPTGGGKIIVFTKYLLSFFDGITIVRFAAYFR